MRMKVPVRVNVNQTMWNKDTITDPKYYGYSPLLKNLLVMV